jgi:predicted phage terminase large subunit-like protein
MAKLNYKKCEPDKFKMLESMYLDIFTFADVLFGDKENSMHYHVRDKSPYFHKEIAKTLIAMESGQKLAVVAPRDHAKSTFINLIYPLHRILFGEERFLLLISESEMQSKYNLEAIGNEIEFNPKIHYFFGDRKGEVWGKEEKEVVGGFDKSGKPNVVCKCLIRGTGQKVRGLKYGAYRPTLTIIDDGEGESNSTTPTARDKFRRWLNAAVIPGSGDAKLVFIGTIVDTDAYLNRIAGPMAYDKDGNYKVKGWQSLFFQAVPQDLPHGRFSTSGNEFLDKKGNVKVLWKERRPYSWLMAERERLKSEGDIAYFYQEYQNIPVDDSFRIFKERDMRYWEGRYLYETNQSYIIRTDEDRREKLPVNVFIGVDPASSENVKADYTVIMVIAVDKDYNIYVLDYFRGQVAPMDGADKIFELADIYNPKDIKIEETGHVMLADYVMRHSKEIGRFYNINTRKAIKTKYYRIKQMQPHFASHSVYLKDEHHELETELLNFKEHGTFKKDTLDALRWALDDIWSPDVEQNEKGEWLPPEPIMEVDWETGQMFTPSDFYEA